MADAIAALGLAASVLQFLDFGSRFVTLAWRIYKTGSDGIHDAPSLQVLVKDLQDVLASLQKPGPGDSVGMGHLAEECSRVARRLLESLNCLGIPDKYRKRDAIKAAFRTMWRRDEIRALQQELDRFRQQLSLQLLLSLRNIASKSTGERALILQTLGAETEKLVRALDEASAKQEAIGQSILDFLTTSVSSGSRDTYRNFLRQDLLCSIYLSDRSESPEVQPELASSPTHRNVVAKKFLDRLQFSGMGDREVQIAQAHESTFQWIFRDPPESYNRTWSSFRQFLESDESNLYWITGKAGSGKSTLMKFIGYEPDAQIPAAKTKTRPPEAALHPSTMCYQYLSRWMGDSVLFTAMFYFWNSGVHMLTAQAGLFRSILHQLLGQDTSLIPEVAASRWEALCLFGEDPKDMTDDELENMLISTVRLLSRKGRVCLFVDGLDEFEGHPMRLINLFDKLRKEAVHIKICVASRPWPDFEEAFGMQPSLMLHNFTYPDIQRTVTFTLKNDPGFKQLHDREPNFADELINNVVQKSCGVFLWVKLVVASLIDGMRYGDRVPDLQKRLDQLPGDLENLYEKMLLGLDPLFLEDSVQYFAMVRHAPEPVTVLLLSFMDEDSPGFVLRQAIMPLSELELQARIDATSKRLNNRTKGLLEVDRSMQLAPEMTVQYLHRTVKDYIESDKAKRVINMAVGKDFDHNLRFSAGYLSLIKNLSKHQLWKSEFPRLVRQCLAAAAAAMSKSKENTISVLDELNRTGIALAKEVAAHPEASGQLCEEVRLLLRAGVWVLTEQPTFEPAKLNYASLLQPASFGRTFLSLAVRCRLAAYVAVRANRGCLVQRASIAYDRKISLGHKPTVRHTIWPLLLDAVLAADVDPCLVHVLLMLGADPNYRVLGNPDHTPWVKVLEWAILRYRGYFNGGASFTSSLELLPTPLPQAPTPSPEGSDSMLSGSFGPSSWLQVEWVQTSWAALYEGEWTQSKPAVFRKNDPTFLQKPPCRPIIKDMISHGAVVSRAALVPIMKRTCGANSYGLESGKILAAFTEVREEVAKKK